MWGKFWLGLTFCDMNASNYYFKIMLNCLPSFAYFSTDYYALRLRKLSCRCHTDFCTKKGRNPVAHADCSGFYVSRFGLTSSMWESVLPAHFVLENRTILFPSYICVHAICARYPTSYFCSKMVSKGKAMCWQEFNPRKVKEEQTNEQKWFVKWAF